jgi:hypothetical protein
MVRARKQALRNGMHLHMRAHIETTSTFAGRASHTKLPWWLHVYKRTNGGCMSTSALSATHGQVVGCPWSHAA